MHRRILPGEIPTFLAAAYSKVPAALAQQGLQLSGPPYARYQFKTTAPSTSRQAPRSPEP